MLKTNPVVSRAFVRRRREVVAGTFVGEEDGRRRVRGRGRAMVGGSLVRIKMKYFLDVVCFSMTEAFASPRRGSGRPGQFI
jgi:hypothetical protein